MSAETDTTTEEQPVEAAAPAKKSDDPTPKRMMSAKRSPAILPTTGWTAWLTMLLAGVMCLLAVLTLSASMAANRLAAEWRADLAGVATVRVSGTREGMTDRIRSVLEVLRTTPGISRVRVLSDEEQAALIAPWLGQGEILSDLPVPRLIDVVLDGAGPDVDALQARLNLTVEGARYDDHAAWRGPLAEAAGALERLALGATLIILLTAAGVVAFAARATLSANRRVIETLRLVGGEDRFIARSFVRRLARRAAIGAFSGALLGCAILKFLPGVDEGLILPKVEAGQRLGVSLEPGLIGWAVLAIGIPLVISMIVWLAARFTVQLTLSRMP
ncbi:MAG: FtsX-like permease family protein [Pseudomonadota bacterium]